MAHITRIFEGYYQFHSDLAVDKPIYIENIVPNNWRITQRQISGYDRENLIYNKEDLGGYTTLRECKNELIRGEVNYELKSEALEKVKELLKEIFEKKNEFSDLELTGGFARREDLPLL